MKKLLKATVVVNENSNQIQIREGMNIEFMGASSNSSLLDKDKEEICKQLENKYNVKVNVKFFRRNMINIEKM